MGYRYYDKCQKPVAFPFGFGLSYTTFQFTDFHVVEHDSVVSLSVAITNRGHVDGAQVVQVYIQQQKPSINRPPKELKGYQKVFLRAGMTRTTEIIVSKKEATSFWDEVRDSWVMEKGSYDILVGDSSASTPLKAHFDVPKTIWWRGL